MSLPVVPPVSLHRIVPFMLCDVRVLQLVSIRRCGRSDCFFYMEVGRSSCTGEGELWMQTEDNNIADNMYAAILQ